MHGRRALALAQRKRREARHVKEGAAEAVPLRPAGADQIYTRNAREAGSPRALGGQADSKIGLQAGEQAKEEADGVRQPGSPARGLLAKQLLVISTR